MNEKLKFLMLVSKTEAIISRKFNGQGLGLADIAVLHAISQMPDKKITRTELADQVGLTASGVTRLLIPLEKLGIVKRESCSTDGRIGYATLTKSGQELLDNSLSQLEERLDDVYPELNKAKLEQACSLLQTLTR